jgi:hypothetical protein
VQIITQDQKRTTMVTQVVKSTYQVGKCIPLKT